MKFDVEFAVNAERDLDLIFRFLAQSHLEFGASRAEARARAAKRIGAIVRAATAIGAAPYQGTLRNELQLGLRAVTKDRAIFYFDVDDDNKMVRIQAVFFGSQDHQRAMLKRLLGSD